ncbi:MAG: hypothetical protein GY847_00715, partial [Proteobacteria bacterium]|nr:hypothetical protein [Pseudomonadota bacterium]
GLIVGPGIYSFVHKSVAEYLVAEAILQGDQRDESGRRIDRFMLFEHRDDDRWNTVTFLWAGLAPVADVESFIGECIEAETWGLAYGVLFDQYEQIPKEIRRPLLLEIFGGRRPTLLQEDTFWWITSRPGAISDIELGIPTFRMQSLSANTGFFHQLVPFHDGFDITG